MATLDLPPALDDALGACDIIVFDGVCVLCSGFIRFILEHDRAERFTFALAQSPLGQEIYRALDLPTEALETNLVILNGQVWTKLDAFGAAMSRLGWPWKLLALAVAVPGILGNPIYNAIARNRYQIWGRTEQCMLPSAELKARFLDEITPSAAMRDTVA